MPDPRPHQPVELLSPEARGEVVSTLDNLSVCARTIKAYLDMIDYCESSGIEAPAVLVSDPRQLSNIDQDHDLGKLLRLFVKGQKEIARNLTKGQLDEVKRRSESQKRGFEIVERGKKIENPKKTINGLIFYLDGIKMKLRDIDLSDEESIIGPSWKSKYLHLHDAALQMSRDVIDFFPNSRELFGKENALYQEAIRDVCGSYEVMLDTSTTDDYKPVLDKSLQKIADALAKLSQLLYAE